MKSFFFLSFIALAFSVNCDVRNQHLISVDLSNVRGYVDPGFYDLGLAESVNEKIANGDLKGIDVAGTSLGCKSFNLYGGVVDTQGSPWGPETLVQVFTAGGVITSTVMAIGVELGHWGWGDSVCPYWPEYCQNGKEGTTVEMLSSYSHGVCAYPEHISMLDTKNFSKIESMLESASPLWVPGTQHGFASWTQSHLINAFVRRADPLHRRVDVFFDEEVVGRIPESLEFYTEMTEDLIPRVAHLFDNQTEQEFGFFNSIICGNPHPNYDEVCRGLMPLANPMYFNDDQVKLDTWAPSASMYTNAENLAVLYGVLASHARYNNLGLGSHPNLRHATSEVYSGLDSFYGLIQPVSASFTRAGWEMARLPGRGFSSNAHSTSWIGRDDGLGTNQAGMNLERQVSWSVITNDVKGVFEPERASVAEIVDLIGEGFGFEI